MDIFLFAAHTALGVATKNEDQSNKISPTTNHFGEK